MSVFQRFILNNLILIMSVLSGAVVFILGDYFYSQYSTLKINEEHQRLENIVNEQAVIIQYALKKAIDSTYILAHEVHRNNGQITQKKFNIIGKKLKQRFPSTTNIQLAPNGIVKYIYPLEGNTSAIGHDLFNDKNRLTAANLALETQLLTIAGPLTLLQGGEAVIGRNPIYLSDNNKLKFWGFATALILIDDLLSTTHLKSLEQQGYHYQLTVTKSPKQARFKQHDSALAPHEQHISAKAPLYVPNGQWQLTLFMKKPRIALLEITYYFFIFLISTLITVFMAKILLQPHALRLKVKQRTKELLISNQELIKLGLDLEDKVDIRTADFERLHKEYKALFESSNDAIIVLSDKQIVRNNIAATNLFLGTSSESLSAFYIDDFLTGEDNTFNSHFYQQLNDNLTQRNECFEWAFKNAEGTSFFVEISSSSIDTDGEQLKQLIIRNISKRKGMEEKLRLSMRQAEKGNQAKSQFLATMSHEIRTPMTAIMGMSDLLLCEVLNEKQDKMVNIIAFSVRSLLTLVDSILDFSKIESGQLNIESNVYNLHELISQINTDINNEAGEKGLKFTYSMNSCVPQYVLGDIKRLEQVLLSLANNALKFTEKGSISLSVDAEEIGNKQLKLLFELKDTGIGISPERHKDIFNIFFQVDNSVSRRYSGTGLGLSISQQLIILMGGQIELRTSALNKGSCFSFYIISDIIDINIKAEEL